MTQSYEEAARYFRLAAGQRLAEAQHDLGGMYYDVDGVTQSLEEAARSYTRLLSTSDPSDEEDSRTLSSPRSVNDTT